MTRQHVILCEGYDDRAFWAGWLLHLGCEDPAGGKPPGKRPPVFDAWGQKVEGGGKFLFKTPDGSSVLVHPFHGREEARRTAKSYSRQHPTKPVARMIINLDSDADEAEASTSARDLIEGIVRDLGEDIPVHPVIWECPDEDVAGVPRKQTLERLVSAAIASAYSGRGRAVADWLAAEPVAEKTTHKNHGLSYLAKWYAEHGPDDFFKALWRDAAVAEELKARLETTGAWQHVEALVAA